MESQPKLKLFESPLAHDRNSVAESTVTISGPLGISSSTNSEKPYIQNIYNDRADDVIEYRETVGNYAFDTPEFRRYEEATNIELFYDLFFVANLTTFTDALDINDSSTLRSYAGFSAFFGSCGLRSPFSMSDSSRIASSRELAKQRSLV